LDYFNCDWMNGGVTGSGEESGNAQIVCTVWRHGAYRQAPAQKLQYYATRMGKLGLKSCFGKKWIHDDEIWGHGVMNV